MRTYILSQNLSLLSLILKAAIGFLIILAPRYWANPAIFGEYAIMLSLITIGAAIFDCGLAGALIATPARDQGRIKQYSRYTSNRNVGAVLLLILVWTVVPIPTSWQIALSCAMCTAASASSLAEARARTNYHQELTGHILALITIGIAAALLESGKLPEPELTTFLLLFSGTPRLVTATYIHSARWLPRSTEKKHDSPHQTCTGVVGAPTSTPSREIIPFALHGLLTTSTANLDILLATITLTPTQVGNAKIVSTIASTALMLNEMLAQNAQTKILNGDQAGYTEKIIRSLGNVSAYTSITVAATIFTASHCTKALAGVNAVDTLLIALATFLKSTCLIRGALLAINGRQRTRLAISTATNISYFSTLYILTQSHGISGLFYSMAISSTIQYAMYKTVRYEQRQ